MANTTFVVSASDGAMDFSEDMFTSLARVLLDMTGRTVGLAITELDTHVSKVSLDTESNQLIVKKKNTKVLQQHVIDFTVDQAKAVKQLHNLAEMAELTRDNLMTSILGVINSELKEVEPVRDPDVPASKKKTVAMVEMASTTTKH